MVVDETLLSRNFARSICEATAELIHLYGDEFAAETIIAVVKRAQVQARELYAASALQPPPPSAYAALIYGMARQRLAGYPAHQAAPQTLSS